MEFASSASYKQYVIDNEIIGMTMRAVRGIEVTDETIALDAYRRVGPGGNFLADPHTIKWMRREHYLPRLSDRQLRINWEKAGSPTVEEKAVAAAKRILKDHKPSAGLNDSCRAQRFVAGAVYPRLASVKGSAGDLTKSPSALDAKPSCFFGGSWRCPWGRVGTPCRKVSPTRPGTRAMKFNPLIDVR